ncbi:MAG: phenylalanine--tRNA ligase subunit beta [Gemmatimonadales bacterium]
MNASRRWLEALLRRPLRSDDLAARLAMLGAPVDSIEPVGADLSRFVVGLVTEAHPHPNADKLRVTTVDDGSGTLWTVVCGAPNVVAGGRYPFARVGTVMPGGMMIEKRKLRGEVSEGMLCSARELGLGDDHDGLLTLDTDAAPGTPLLDVLDVGDERLVIDVTPNRGDLLGHVGIARELAASLGVQFRLPEIPGEAGVEVAGPARFGDEAPVGGVRLAIEDRAGCRRFLAATIRGVRVGPSPEWLRNRLVAVGSRSINNIVDATNYILLELNQPMHAYDVSQLHGPAIVARAARAGECVVTLDGVRREMPEGALVIADADRVVGVAGVMGGRDTQVRDSTTDIFLECAWFDPVRVRRSRRALDLATDASHRFERGTDRWGAVDALRRCIRLIVTLAGGALDGGAADCYPEPGHPPRIFLRPSRVAQVLGVPLPINAIEKCLVAIGATVVAKPGDDRIAVGVPGWRSDLVSEIDLVEEVARIHGYDQLPTELRPFRPGLRDDDAGWAAAERLRTALAGYGLAEVVTMPMVAGGAEGGLRIVNPVSADHAELRPRLLPSLVREVETDWSYRTADVRLFEVGTAFSGGGTPPSEAMHVAFVVTGARAPRHWTEGGKGRDWDRWDAIGIFEDLVALAHPAATVQVEGARWIAVTGDGATVGSCGSCDADAPPWAAPLFGGEIRVVAATAAGGSFVPLPVFPPVVRDITVGIAVRRPVAELVALLGSRGRRDALETVAVVDEYRGQGVAAGQRNITLRLVFRAADRTLTDAEVERAMQRLRGALERERDVTVHAG